MDVGEIVGRCASLAALLEVSAYPKPGNVHRTRDFPDTKYEHFLAGSVTLGSYMSALSRRAHEIHDSDGDLSKLGLGEAIFNATYDMLQWQSGGNTHLGINLLLSPLAAAAGIVLKDGVCDLEELREALHRVTNTSTPDDSLWIYRAIDSAMSAETLGTVDELSVKEESSLDWITQRSLTPIDVFKECQNRDSICYEWVSDYEISFMEGYQTLRESIEKRSSINDAVLNTFIKILSNHPDSLILRKNDLRTAEKVSKKAKKIESEPDKARKMEMIQSLDEELSKEAGKMNPGTTADLTAASLFLLLLTGWRP